MNTLAGIADQPFELLQALDARFRAARLDATSAASQNLWSGLAFRLRDRTYLVPRGEVREVIPPVPLTRVPGGKDFLMGVANIRGVLKPVTDLGRLWGEPPISERRDQRLLVLNSRQIPAAFIVDGVLGYRQFVPADQRHELVEKAGTVSPFLLGAFTREAQIWLVLSLHKVARSSLFTQSGLLPHTGMMH